jgi:hypothetical protein
MIYNMEKVLKHGLMGVNMKVDIKKEWNMVKEHINGLIKAYILVIGMIIKYKER